MIDGNELSIFPDQTEFISRLAQHGSTNAMMNIPGTTISVDPGNIHIDHGVSDA